MSAVLTRSDVNWWYYKKQNYEGRIVTQTLGIGNLEVQKFLLQEAMSGQRKPVARGDYIGRQKDYTDTPQP
jgi:hypothetical protein